MCFSLTIVKEGRTFLMLSTAYSYLKNINPTANVHLFGQELMGQSYAVGLAEMLIKNQNIDS